MKASIGRTLAELRRTKKLMQKDVAAKLSGYGFSVSAKTIYNWEKGLAQPGIQHFLALCDILGVDDVMWQFAGIHRGPYSGLNQAGRQKAREFIDLLFHIDMYRDDPEEYIEAPRLLPSGLIQPGVRTFVDTGEPPQHIVGAQNIAERQKLLDTRLRKPFLPIVYRLGTDRKAIRGQL